MKLEVRIEAAIEARLIRSPVMHGRPGQMELEKMGGRTGGVEDQAHSAGSGRWSAITTGRPRVRLAAADSAESSDRSKASAWEVVK